MGPLQHRGVRLQPLNIHSILRIAAATVVVVCAGCSLHAAPAPRRHTLALSGLRSGKAVFEQHDRITSLILTIPPAASVSIPLLHKGKYPQWTDGPWQSHLVAEVPGRFLIFTDTLASNPTNVQGECGASETGERYLHVISLAPPLRETFSTLIESCWLDLTPEPSIPVFDPGTMTITVHFAADHGDTTKRYRIRPDNSVELVNP